MGEQTISKGEASSTEPGEFQRSFSREGKAWIGSTHRSARPSAKERPCLPNQGNSRGVSHVRERLGPRDFGNHGSQRARRGLSSFPAVLREHAISMRTARTRNTERRSARYSKCGVEAWDIKCLKPWTRGGFGTRPTVHGRFVNRASEGAVFS
eukprot:sb/3473352/